MSWMGNWKVPKLKHCMQYMYRSAYFSIWCTQCSPISSQFSQFVFSLKMIVVSVVTPVICHVYHSWIKPVPLGNYRPGLTRVKVDVDQSTISRWRRKFRETDVKDRPRSGRPRITTPDEDRYICLVSLHNWRMSSRIIQTRLAGRHWRIYSD